ncbi:MAG: hypothetical protein ABJF50_17830 [Paracoccaceae bacterium]
MLETKKAAAKSRDLIEASTITRLLVVSFFVALSLGLIEGADIKLLATPFLPENIALLIMRALVLVLCVMILVGYFRKPAALILALIVFWPAYISLFAGGDVSAFWRDLALIGGLIMSASNGEKADAIEQAETETHHRVEVVTYTPDAKKADEPNDDGAYREDFNLARSV